MFDGEREGGRGAWSVDFAMRCDGVSGDDNRHSMRKNDDQVCGSVLYIRSKASKNIHAVRVCRSPNACFSLDMMYVTV